MTVINAKKPIPLRRRRNLRFRMSYSQVLLMQQIAVVIELSTVSDYCREALLRALRKKTVPENVRLFPLESYTKLAQVMITDSEYLRILETAPLNMSKWCRDIVLQSLVDDMKIYKRELSEIAYKDQLTVAGFERTSSGIGEPELVVVQPDDFDPDKFDPDKV